MDTYRLIWQSLTLALGTAGVAAAVFTWPVAAIFTVLVVFALITACVIVSLSEERPRLSVRRTLMLSGGIGLAVLAVGGLLTLAPVVGWALLVLAAVSSPSAIRFCRKHVQAPRATPEAPVEPAPLLDFRAVNGTGDPAPLGVRRMSTEQLCLEWCGSFTALQAASSPAAQAAIVRLRQAYLDELARRNPAGLTEWLESGARVASNPGRFVAKPEAGHPSSYHAEERHDAA